MAFVTTKINETAEDPAQFINSSGENVDSVICKNPGKLKLLLSCLQPGKQIHYVSDGDWSMHDLVLELVKKYKPAELYFTTYAIREFPIRQLVMAQDRKELLCVKILLDYRAKSRTPEVYQLLQMNANKVYLTAIHAKVTVLRSAAGCVSIVGSANWTQNPRTECGVISLDTDVANFHINWIEKLMDNAEIFE